MRYSLLDFFTDPVLRAPTIGSILMCLASSLVGVIVFVRKRSLLGEALSHACYPGVVVGAVALASFVSPSDDLFAAGLLACAFISSILGLFAINLLQTYFKVKDDASLCFILSSFFGIGILLASRIQITHALWYRHIQTFLYGQAATMRDVHIAVYGALFLFTVLSLLIFYRDIGAVVFDRQFAKSAGLKVRSVEILLSFLLALAIVIGIRSVGVVLMSGMLIAPAVAARQLTHRLSSLFLFAATVGAVSGFGGNYLSVMIPEAMEASGAKFSLPTGPMILLVAAAFCLAALSFSPERGLLSRILRARRFRLKCEMENILKCFWKKEQKRGFSLRCIMQDQGLSSLTSYLRLKKLKDKGLLAYRDGCYTLTEKGRERAGQIVRLHRLWEVYLVQLGHSKEKVHASAEEMEHVLTPEIEKELEEFLNHPMRDPHNQPIPRSGL